MRLAVRGAFSVSLSQHRAQARRSALQAHRYAAARRRSAVRGAWSEVWHNAPLELTEHGFRNYTHGRRLLSAPGRAARQELARAGGGRRCGYPTADVGHNRPAVVRRVHDEGRRTGLSSHACSRRPMVLTTTPPGHLRPAHP